MNITTKNESGRLIVLSSKPLPILRELSQQEINELFRKFGPSPVPVERFDNHYHCRLESIIGIGDKVKASMKKKLMEPKVAAGRKKTKEEILKVLNFL